MSGEVVIDLSNLSFEEAARLSMMDANIGRAAILQERISVGGATPDTLDELLRLTTPERLLEHNEYVRYIMAKVVKSVPPEWMVSSAPAGVPLDDPETYKHMRNDRVRDLRQQIMAAINQPGEATKN